MLYKELCALAKSHGVAIPQHCTKKRLEELLLQRHIVQTTQAPSVPKKAPAPRKTATPTTPKMAVPRKSTAPKATVAPRGKKSKRQHPGDGWQLLSEGRDGAAYRRCDVVRKKFSSKAKASKEAECLQTLDASGVAPHFISYDGNLTLDMGFVNGVTLRSYISKLKQERKTASEAVQNSFLRVIETLRALRIDPNDNNLLNFMVDVDAQKVYRIDYSAYKKRAVPYDFLLLTKIHDVMPLVAIAWKPHLYKELPLVWKDIIYGK